MTREEAIKTIQEMCKRYIFMLDEDEAIDMAIEALSVAVSREDTVTLNSPITIQAEMVAVVLCKDCYHYDKGENESESWQYCRFLRHNTSDDDFCSWAERRE